MHHQCLSQLHHGVAKRTGKCSQGHLRNTWTAHLRRASPTTTQIQMPPRQQEANHINKTIRAIDPTRYDPTPDGFPDGGSSLGNMRPQYQYKKLIRASHKTCPYKCVKCVPNVFPPRPPLQVYTSNYTPVFDPPLLV